MATERGATDPGLERVQRWMQALIQDQGSCEEAIQSKRAQAEIPAEQAGAVVLPSKTLSSFERLNIYREMYLLRMEEALASDYPALKQFLGGEEFMRMVARYVEVYPSRSYTLNRLGDHVPEFVATLEDLPEKDFCYDLARLELALTGVFDAGETAPLAAEAVRAVPQEAWETARLKPIEAFCLLEFEYPVSRYLGFVDEENPAPRLGKKKTWVVAYRSKYRVHRMDLTEAGYALLAALAAGTTVGDAIVGVMTRRWRPAVKQKQLFEWFRDWMAEGLFQAVEVAKRPEDGTKPEGSAQPETEREKPQAEDEVDEAGEESFPASDAPPWTA